MSLHARIRHRLGSFRLDVTLEAEPGETVAVLGPNGSGKSTLFRCLSGLLPIDDGRIALDGIVLDDPETNTFMAPERRPVAVVFQEYLLFPNLTARDNVAFGLRTRKVSRAQARARALVWLERLGLGDQAEHRPAALSGGQAQRVALARALATEPRLLLLDEPLAALDVGTRSTIRRDLRRHLASYDGVRLLVTHDPVDAHALADRVVILEQGAVTQQGTLASLTAHPRSRYIADLVGLNLLRGHGDGVTITTSSGAQVVTAEPVHGETFAAIQPRSIALYRTPPTGSPRNSWPVIVADVDRQADRARVAVTGAVSLVAEVTTAALDELGLTPGDAVWASVKATEITTYPT
jgi:molybdate transport system ATP-binding protein